MLGNCQLPSVWEGRGYGNGSWPSVSGGWAPTPRNARQLSVAERLGGSGPRSPYEVCSDIADQTPRFARQLSVAERLGGVSKFGLYGVAAPIMDTCLMLLEVCGRNPDPAQLSGETDDD